MADELTSLLQRGLETKRQTFADDDFAGEHGQGVIGRVKRRRAVSATALGGGTVVAVGAVAVGAWQLPRAGLGFGGPGGSPSVVCTTTTPDAVAKAGVEVPHGATYVVTEIESGGAYFVGAMNGVPQLWGLDGTPYELGQNADGTGVVELLSGAIVTINQVTGDVTPADPEAVVVTPADAYLLESTSSVIVIGADGTVLGHALKVADGGLVLVTDGKMYKLTSSEGGTYTYVSRPDQAVNAVTLGDTQPASGSSEDVAAPEVTCVTTTPEPNASASPSSSPAISAQPSATPDPAVSDSFGSVASPFQCGFDLASAHPNPAAQFRDLHWVTADAAETSVRAFFQDPDEIDFNLSGDSVPIVMYDFGVGPEFDSASGVIGHQDPQGSLAGFGTTDGVQDTVQFAVGAAYILVQDGAVVATYVPDGAPSSQYIDSYDPDTGTLYGLNVDDAFTTCSGEDVASLGDTDLYAVVGWIAEDPDGVHGPLYGWSKIEPQG